ncbi:unnamed protein product [Caenorhabditis sp. 36 PRJEB53466]|nr:unnamed protein product [Caenorhabditis sp. 36 PRJEB53466]
MRPSTSVLVFLLLICSIAFLASEASPSANKHARCVHQVVKSLTELCNGQSELDTMRQLASRCCKENCDFSEMVAACGSSAPEDSF